MRYPKGTRELNRDAKDMGIGLTRQIPEVAVNPLSDFLFLKVWSDRVNEMRPIEESIGKSQFGCLIF